MENNEEKSIIVLHTKGKNHELTNLIVKLFDSIEEAEEYCAKNTDTLKDQKYWDYSEIIKQGVEYEPTRYRNYEK